MECPLDVDKFPYGLPSWLGFVSIISVALSCQESVQSQRDSWGKEPASEGTEMILPRGRLKVKFLC